MSIRSCVTVSLVEAARGGPFVFWDDLPAACRQARELGFDAIEIFPPSPSAIDVEAVRKLLADHELKLAAVGTGAGWVLNHLRLTGPEPGERDRARRYVRGIIDVAGPLGASAIIGSMQGRWGDGVDRDMALGHLKSALGELGEHARQYNVPLIYEPLNRYETNLVNTVADGVSLLKSLAGANVVLLADLFHMNIEEADLAAALVAGAGYIGHVHFVDSNRRPAGYGHMDYAPIAAALRETGYDGYLSAEAFAWPDSLQAARQTIDTFRTFFGG
ncbi:MAG TPA: sugar phosphate isomerase/epimerase family protein [Pirellulales bacterium]|jgi:sugar phosphate isomerase/epimerase|nr:sugar phosphate isomerase/epimerase family protein [Pirellulales bacterium]